MHFCCVQFAHLFKPFAYFTRDVCFMEKIVCANAVFFLVLAVIFFKPPMFVFVVYFNFDHRIGTIFPKMRHLFTIVLLVSEANKCYIAHFYLFIYWL